MGVCIIKPNHDKSRQKGSTLLVIITYVEEVHAWFP